MMKTAGFVCFPGGGQMLRTGRMSSKCSAGLEPTSFASPHTPTQGTTLLNLEGEWFGYAQMTAASLSRSLLELT